LVLKVIAYCDMRYFTLYGVFILHFEKGWRGRGKVKTK